MYQTMLVLLREFAASPLAQDVVFVVLSRDFDQPVIKHIMNDADPGLPQWSAC